ncbi:MAG: transglycosylase SLT domain-containing protein [Deltaproteobacteria bacterium]|nr:transglycosylase SLT domain-containing protein [Deltaproteobacteria bacterium]
MKTRNQFLGLAAFAFLFLAGCSGASKSPETAHRTDHSRVADFDIPIVMNDKVQGWLDFFQGAGRERFALYLERSHKYLPMMRAIFKEQGLPSDLVYVALIESGFNPRAFSRARASGTWQFMYRTGVRYGLKANAWVDERRDPKKATLAASLYLRDLYALFNDWYLAMAAYNAGEGKVGRAIRRYDTLDFWEVAGHPYLRAETKNYVPKMIAAALIAKNPKKFGFKQLNYEEPLDHETVLVDGMMDLRVAARLAERDYEELKELNPELKLWLTPPNTTYELKLPTGTARRFEENYAALPPEQRIAEKVVVVKKGETLHRIAKREGLPPTYVSTVNGASPVRPGRSLLIPYPPPEGERWALVDESKRKVKARHKGSRSRKMVLDSKSPEKKQKASKPKPAAPRVAKTDKEV